MKRLNLLLRIFLDAALITCGNLAVVCAVPSAFRLPFEVGTLTWIFAIGALLLSAWMHIPKYGIIFGAIFFAVVAVYGILDHEAIRQGAKYAWYCVLEPLSMDFSMLPIPQPVEDLLFPAAAVTSFLTVVGSVLGLLLAFALIKGSSALLSVLVPLPPFLLSLVYTDQQPALWTVILLMIYVGGALLGVGVRRGEQKRLSVYLAIVLPLLTAFALLIAAFSPAEEFTPIPFEQRKEMLGERAEAVEDLMLSIIKQNPKRYNLNKQDDRKESDEKAFSVYATGTGTFLLRSHSYAQYNNGVWEEAEEYEGKWHSMDALSARAGGETVRLVIRDAMSSERYVPYAYRYDPSLKQNESYIRSSGRTVYEWSVYSAVDLTPTHVSEEEQLYVNYAQTQYTMPDGDYKDMLLSIARDAGLLGRKDRYQTALAVASYVKNSGTYSLEPGKLPRGRDFIEYFLNESHTGYCVHFASATAALLQAMDIPARYTIGYRAVIPVSETWFDVTERVAHAWVEVYVPSVGWIPIESTAGFSYDLLNEQTVQPGSSQQTSVTPSPSPTPVPTPDPASVSTAEPEDPETEPPELPNKRTPVPTERPGQSGENQLITDPNTASEPPESAGGAWWILLLVPVLLAGWTAFGMMIRKRRMTAFRQKDSRKAVLAMLRYLKRLERFGVSPDPRAEAWTEEAAYSDHDMSDKQRLLLGKVKRAQSGLYLHRPLLRFFAKWVLIVI